MDKALRGYSDVVPTEYAEFCLCRELGWTFNDLDDQPAWRIDQAFLFLDRESKYKKTLQDD